MITKQRHRCPADWLKSFLCGPHRPHKLIKLIIWGQRVAVTISFDLSLNEELFWITGLCKDFENKKRVRLCIEFLNYERRFRKYSLSKLLWSMVIVLYFINSSKLRLHKATPLIEDCVDDLHVRVFVLEYVDYIVETHSDSCESVVPWLLHWIILLIVNKSLEVWRSNFIDQSWRVNRLPMITQNKLGDSLNLELVLLQIFEHLISQLVHHSVLRYPRQESLQILLNHLELLELHVYLDIRCPGHKVHRQSRHLR